MIKKVKTFLKKLTLFDYLLVLLLISGVFFYLFLFKREQDTIYVDIFSPSHDWSEDSYPINRWQAEALKKNGKAYDTLGNEIADIVNVYRIPWEGGGKEYVFATLELKATYNKNLRVYSFQGSPLLVGNDFSIELSNTALEGRVINIYKDIDEINSRLQPKKVLITVIYRHQEPAVVEKFSTKTELFNSAGELMLKVIDFQTDHSKSYEPNWQGQIVQSIHPSNQDVIVKILIPKATCSEYSCFYNQNFPLTVGFGFGIDFGDLVVGKDSIITDIEYL